MDKITVGVVGAGHLGAVHLKKYKNIGEVQIAGFWDRDENVRNKVQSELGIQPASSLEDLLGRVHAISIVVPTTGHKSIALAAAERGVHLFIEKPIALSLQDADEIIEAAEKFSLMLQIGHIERFNAAFRAVMQEQLQPLFIESHRLALFNPRGLDVSVVLDLMIHDIDLILQLVPSEIKKIDTSGVGVISETSDIVNARLTFANGAVANITASRISQKTMRKMRLFQRDTYISMDFVTGEAEIYRIAQKGESFGNAGTLPVMDIAHEDILKTVGFKRIPHDGMDSLELELRSFVQAIIRNETPAVTGADARKALAIALDILKKIKM